MIIFLDCTTFVLFEMDRGDPERKSQFALSLSVNTSCDALAHWNVAYAYLIVILEIEALLDKETHMSNIDKLEEISKKKRKLFIASCVAVAVCILNGVGCYIGFQIESDFLIVGTQFNVLFFNTFFLCLWGMALIKLNKKIKGSANLIPN